MDSRRRGSAPGRLDLLGGVADYSGALVLETPTALTTTVTAEPADALVVGPVSLTPEELVELARLPYPKIRDALRDAPRWTRYPLGVALVLVRHGVIEPPRVRLEVSSNVPQSLGVSSSAALEVATARALGTDDLDALRLAALCQEAENHVVGAPCGIMDQVTVAMGAHGAILPILCRPAGANDREPGIPARSERPIMSVRTPVRLPPGVEVVGWPTGAEHDVSGAPYRRARAAAFMGKRIVEDARGRTWSWVSELPRDAVDELPETLGGAAFIERWRDTDDDVTAVDPGETYPVRAATRFGVEEHVRGEQALACLERGDVAALGPLLAASHAGYDAMGLGHPAASATVDAALDRPGVHGARSSGGGCGGTVVVLCDRGALDDVDVLIR
jgi:galactokinase